jgi:large subunit ribosomal protein L3
MAKRNRPRRGSLGFKPRKRAKKQTPRIHSWVASKEAKPLGFAGYKAGMTHVMAVDKRKNSLTAGLEIFIPVTVIDSPPMIVAAIRAYRKGYHGKEALTDVYSSKLGDAIRNRIDLPKVIDTEKGLKEIEANVGSITDVRLVVETQPGLASLERKVPDLMEIALGGTVSEKLEYAKKVLGKEISAEDVLSKNKVFDVTSVSKGKGYQGIIKRIGTRIQPRKTEKGRRHGGTGGAWTPARKLWLWPLPGQLGYHTRTEHNKVVIELGQEGKNVNPKGGFLNYGEIKGPYVLLYGSVPGASKRLIRFSPARRPPKDEANFEITYIDQSSKQGF